MKISNQHILCIVIMSVTLFFLYLTFSPNQYLKTIPVLSSPAVESVSSEIPQQSKQIKEVVDESPVSTYTAKTVVPTPSPSLEPTVEATSCTQQCEETYEQKKKTTCTALLSAGGSGSYAACLGNIGKEKQACLEECK